MIQGAARVAIGHWKSHLGAATATAHVSTATELRDEVAHLKAEIAKGKIVTGLRETALKEQTKSLEMELEVKWKPCCICLALHCISTLTTTLCDR